MNVYVYYNVQRIIHVYLHLHVHVRHIKPSFNFQTHILMESSNLSIPAAIIYSINELRFSHLRYSKKKEEENPSSVHDCVTILRSPIRPRIFSFYRFESRCSFLSQSQCFRFARSADCSCTARVRSPLACCRRNVPIHNFRSNVNKPRPIRGVDGCDVRVGGAGECEECR